MIPTVDTVLRAALRNAPGWRQAARRLLAPDTQCPICGQRLVRRGERKKTCGKPACVREWRRALKHRAYVARTERQRRVAA